MALYSSRLLFILSLSFSTSLLSYFVSYLISPSFPFSLSFATLHPLSLLLSTPYLLLSPFSFFLLLLPLYTPSIYPLSYPSPLFSPLINAAPKRRFYSLLLYLLYLPIFFQNTSFALYSSRLLFIPSFSFSTSLSSFFYPILFSLISLLPDFSIPFLSSYLFHTYSFLFFYFSTLSILFYIFSMATPFLLNFLAN